MCTRPTSTTTHKSLTEDKLQFTSTVHHATEDEKHEAQMAWGVNEEEGKTKSEEQRDGQTLQCYAVTVQWTAATVRSYAVVKAYVYRTQVLKDQLFYYFLFRESLL